jgi:hypothetical protein
LLEQNNAPFQAPSPLSDAEQVGFLELLVPPKAH